MLRVASTSRPSVFRGSRASVVRDTQRTFATARSPKKSKDEGSDNVFWLPSVGSSAFSEGSHIRAVEAQEVEGRPVVHVRVRPAPMVKRTRFRHLIARFSSWLLRDRLRKNLEREVLESKDDDDSATATVSLRSISLSLGRLLDSNRPLLGPNPSLYRLNKALGEDFVEKMGAYAAPYAKRDLPLHRLRQISLLASPASGLPPSKRPIVIVKGHTRPTFRRTVPRRIPGKIFKKALAGAVQQLRSTQGNAGTLEKPRLVRFRRVLEPVMVDAEGQPTGAVRPIHPLEFIAGSEASAEEQKAIQAEIYYQSLEGNLAYFDRSSSHKVPGLPSRKDRAAKLRDIFAKRAAPAAPSDVPSVTELLQQSLAAKDVGASTPERERLLSEVTSKAEEQLAAFQQANGDLSKLPKDHPAHRLIPLLEDLAAAETGLQRAVKETEETAKAAVEKIRAAVGNTTGAEREAKLEEVLSDPDVQHGVFVARVLQLQASAAGSSGVVPVDEKQLARIAEEQGLDLSAAQSALAPLATGQASLVAALERALAAIESQLPEGSEKSPAEALANALKNPNIELTGAVDRARFLDLAIRSNSLTHLFGSRGRSASDLVEAALLVPATEIDEKEQQLSKSFYTRDRFLYSSINELRALKNSDDIRDAIAVGAVAPNVLKDCLNRLSKRLKDASKKDPTFVTKALNQVLVEAWMKLSHFLDHRGSYAALLEGVPHLKRFFSGDMSSVDFHLNKSPEMFIAEEQFRELMDKKGATIEQRLQIAKNVELSRGVFTIEWALPSPPPEHTFEELPIIKELPDVPEEKAVEPHHH